MSSDSLIVGCPSCGSKNRIPRRRWGDAAVCGRCKNPLRLAGLYPDAPVDVSDSTFKEEVLDFPGPVVLEFFAPW
jgi:thioredoxin 2